MKEHIRRSLPNNLEVESTFNIDDRKNQPQSHQQETFFVANGLSKSKQIYFQRMKRAPIELLKQLSFRNEKVFSSDNDQSQKQELAA